MAPPEALFMPWTIAICAAWFRSYNVSLLHRDVCDLAHIDGLTDLPRKIVV